MTDATRAALQGAAVFDCSATAKILLTGPDAPQFLHNISTNDVNGLPLGGGCELFFCDARARALFLARVYHVRHAGDHALWLETTPGRDEALLKHLDRFLIAEAVELQNVTGDYSQLHVAGPTAPSVVARATGHPVVELYEFQHAERNIGAVPVSVRARTPLGLPGYDLIFPKSEVALVREHLKTYGAVPGDAETYETLRIEGGTPEYGPDIDDNRFVMEVGNAARAVSYVKGCFPGQEPIVMARDRAGRVNRQFLGLRVTSGHVGPKSTLAKDGQDVGLVTSVTQSPRLGGELALGYVHWKHVAPGTELRSGDATLTVLGWPPLAGA